MEKMIVTQALDERDLLKKKIHDAIAKCDFVAVQKPGDDVIAQDKQKVADRQREVMSNLCGILIGFLNMIAHCLQYEQAPIQFVSV